MEYIIKDPQKRFPKQWQIVVVSSSQLQEGET